MIIEMLSGPSLCLVSTHPDTEGCFLPICASTVGHCGAKPEVVENECFWKQPSIKRDADVVG